MPPELVQILCGWAITAAGLLVWIGIAYYIYRRDTVIGDCGISKRRGRGRWFTFNRLHPIARSGYTAGAHYVTKTTYQVFPERVFVSSRSRILTYLLFRGCAGFVLAVSFPMLIFTTVVAPVYQSHIHDTYDALYAALGSQFGAVLAGYGNYMAPHIADGWFLVVWFWLGLSFVAFWWLFVVSARKLLLLRWKGKSQSYQRGDRYR